MVGEAETQTGQNCPEERSESVAEAKRLISDIRKEIDGLREVLLTEEERQEIEKIREDFDRKMQEAVYATRSNLNSYRQGGWKQLLYEEDGDDE